MKNFEKGSTKSVVLAVILTAFVVGSIAVLYFYYININQKHDNVVIDTNVKGSASDTVNDVANVSHSNDYANVIEHNNGVGDVAQTQGNNQPMISTVSGAVLPKGSIEWTDPVIDNTLDVLKSTEKVSLFHVNYYKVGKVVSGKYEGYDVYTITTESDMVGSIVFRMLKKGNQVIFFKGQERFDNSEVDILRDVIGGETQNKIINGNIVVEDLVLPKDITVNGSKLVLKDYAFNFFYPHSYDILKKVSSTQYGDVWTTDRKKADEIFENKKDKSEQDYKIYSIFNTNAFYIKLPDGTVAVYNIAFDFLPDNAQKERVYKLPITWNDGTVNQQEYELYPMGCGVLHDAYDMSSQVQLSDLKRIGMLSDGSDVLGYKSATHPAFEKWYKSLYWEKEGQKKPKEDVLKHNPQIFWQDPFGRILAFYSTQFISPAECGKPVIYLYPKEDMDVHVHVMPTQGFSVTEPEYGQNGWFVHATTEGAIKNYADNKQYPYLFWEGSSDALLPRMENKGFVVKKSELSQFFDSTLVKLGLNSKEITDFKEFWIPQMNTQNTPYYKITFLPKVFINKSAPLTVKPKPDTVIRVLMDYQGLEQYRHVKEQKLYAPKREGFTVVEWGGILH